MVGCLLETLSGASDQFFSLLHGMEFLKLLRSLNQQSKNNFQFILFPTYTSVISLDYIHVHGDNILTYLIYTLLNCYGQPIKIFIRDKV